MSEVKVKDLFSLLRLFGTQAVIRVGFRPGQFRPRAFVIDILCLLYVALGGKLFFYWTGSDVPRTALLLKSPGAIAGYWSIPVTRYLLQHSKHCVAAPWLIKELAEFGCRAKSLPFPTPTDEFEEAGASHPEWPSEFTVLSYVPDHNYSNYCGDELAQLARRMPNVQFRIMGGEGAWCDDCPPNLTFLGWAHAQDQYLKCVVVLRAVRHDAMGGTVREALLCGRYVLYTYPHPSAILLPEPDRSPNLIRDMEENLTHLREKFVCGRLPFNVEGRHWVMANLTEGVLAQRAASFFSEELHEAD
ncbi:MAG: hypothetical protein ABJM11_06385 [Marinobacter sp.]|uniref:hypothetical protein n=1 Tax=Marinobacter sp. TaxID=50741 RepID=UPI0032968667